MAELIGFYLPGNFRKPMKWIPTIERGKIIEFCPPSGNSA